MFGHAGPQHDVSVAERVASIADSRAGVGVVACVVGALAGLISYILHEHVLAPIHFGVDAVITGCSAALITLLLLLALRHRRRQLLQEIARVSELNHQVRNALEVIVHSQYLPPAEQAEMVRQSVVRIDATLHQLYPYIRENRGDGGRSRRTRHS